MHAETSDYHQGNYNRFTGALTHAHLHIFLLLLQRSIVLEPNGKIKTWYFPQNKYVSY